MNHLLHAIIICLFIQSSLSQVPTVTTSTQSTLARLLYQSPACREDIRVDCIVSPCSYTPCHAYPNAICVDNNCGQCHAIFFDHTTGDILSTHLCNTPSNQVIPIPPNPPISITPNPTTPSPIISNPITPTPITPTPIISNTIILSNTTKVAEGTEVTGGEEEEEEEEEGYEYEYPFQVDQYQKTRDNYGVNLNDEMIDIGRDLVNYGDLDINIAWPYDLQPVSKSLKRVIKPLSIPCIPNNINNTKSINNTIIKTTQCIVLNTTNGTSMYYQVIYTPLNEEIGDDPVINGYTIDNVQKTRDNMGLNLNDEVVDIGRDLINYGTLHYNMVPISASGSGSGSASSVSSSSSSSSPCSMFAIPCVVSPCQQSKCPSYPTAICRDDFCKGCNAIFSNPETGHDLTFNDCHSNNNSTNIKCGQDEKICPDGTVVFRQSMNQCQFSLCPIMESNALSQNDPQNDPQSSAQSGPQSAMQSKEQLAPLIIPCILDQDRNCNQDSDCCGDDGICDITGRCVIIKTRNKENDLMEDENEIENRLSLLIVMIFLVLILCILPLLYWCYYKQYRLSKTKIEIKREVLDDISV